jgi:hypothetical protein
MASPTLGETAEQEDYRMATSVKVLESQEAWALPAAKPLNEGVWRAWVAKGRADDKRSTAARIKAVKWLGIAALLAAAGLWFNLKAATPGVDLSRYRNFELGADLPAIAKQVRMNPSQAKTIHGRPALLQDLDWRPQPSGPSSQAEPVEEVVFSFCDGALFRILVQYDRRETEGLTPEDFVDSISQAYGPAAKPAAAIAAPDSYSAREEILAQWQDAQYRFDLIRSSYASTVRLVGVVKKLETSALAATVEAQRLDDLEAPQRDADRLASESQAATVKLEKSRLANKAKFRP